MAAPVAVVLVLAAAAVGIALGVALAVTVGVAAVAVGGVLLARRALSAPRRRVHGLDPAREVFPSASAAGKHPERTPALPPGGGPGADRPG